MLASFAAILKRNAREGDVVGRWGGEEFLILSAGLDGDEVQAYANGLRTRIAHFHLGECETVTASFGTSTCNGATLTDLIGAADQALYAAKAAGRDRVETFQGRLREAA